MGKYAYKARDVNGLLVTGQIEGDALEAIKETLYQQGLIPISVTEGSKRITSDISSLDFFKGVNPEELTLFTRQFYTLFKAGMDMESLLSTLSRQTKNTFFAEALIRIKTDVAAGSSLSRAFAQHPKIFSELYTNMLATGEEAGILEESLSHLSTLLEKENQLKSSVKSATLYPKIVIFVLIIASYVILTFVVPKFAKFYEHYDAELPIPTQLLLGASNIFTNYWYIALATLIALIIAFKKWKATPQGRIHFDRFKWAIPVFGSLGQKVANARFANILGALYRSGLPITRGLEITSRVIENEVFAQDIQIVKADVEKGRGIAESMKDKKYFSPLLVEATAIGEKSGALDEMYFSIGQHYDLEVDNMLKNLTTLIEPILLFMVFGMVTVFALAIFLPMWGMAGVVN